MVARSAIAFASIGLLLAACSPNPPAPMPLPSDSPSPSAFGQQQDVDWLVVARNDYLEASGPVCSWEDILTAPDPEYFGVYLERDPGAPDEAGNYTVDDDGILLQFDLGRYTASRFDGEAGIGTLWETSGTLTFERDAQGVITGGEGTGRTRLIHESGDVEHLDDTLTFTVTLAENHTWCDLP